MYLSVIIPCYNEAQIIGSTLQKVGYFLKEKQWESEIIVVDDGSIDGTAEVARKFGFKVLLNGKNRGKGYSVKRGAEEAQGELILFLDADLSTPIEEIDKLLPYAKDYDVIIGSRVIAGADVERYQPWHKVIGGKIGNQIIKIFLGLNIRDTQCGFKLFKRSALEVFKKQTIDGWGFDFELLYIAKKLGYKIKEVGVIWFNDPDSKVTFGSYWRTLGEVFRVRRNSREGKY